MSAFSAVSEFWGRMGAGVGAGIGAALEAMRQTTDPTTPSTQRIGYVGRTTAGVVITPDNALTVSTVWACVRYLSQTVAGLPWRVCLDKRPNGQGKIQSSHPVDWLLNKRPNAEWSAFQFKETLMQWALRWGNGYAEIERDLAGRPIALWPIAPWRVAVKRRIGSGELYYEISGAAFDSRGVVEIAPRDMFHLRGFGDDVVGVNVVQYAAESIGWARAVQLFGAAFFGNGANLGGFITTPNGLTPEGLKELETRLLNLTSGPRKSNKWLPIDAGMEPKPLAVEPNKAQFIETNQHLVEEICRWFGVPPHKVMHLLRAHFTNVEHQSIEAVQDSIMPWTIRMQQEADYKLFGQNRSGYYTWMNLREIQRGDFKSQQEGLEVARRNGVISANQWIEELDLDPIPPEQGGDKRIVQSQYTTLEKIGEAPGPNPSAPSRSSGDSAPAEDLDEETMNALAAISARARAYPRAAAHA
ncbi:MAG: phage portal protein [Alphaproteobacteria bacterium]